MQGTLEGRPDALAAIERAVPGTVAPTSTLLGGVVQAITWNSVASTAKLVVRWLSGHTGLPALVIAAVLVAIGYRILKKSVRLLVEIAVVALALAAATQLGWIRW